MRCSRKTKKWRCKNEAGYGHKYCPFHIVVARLRLKKRIENGLCIVTGCNKKPLTNKRRCKKHLEKISKDNRKYNSEYYHGYYSSPVYAYRERKKLIYGVI